MNALKAFWYGYVQTTMGSIAALLAGIDLAGYHDSIAEFIGEKGYHGVRLAIAVIVIARGAHAIGSKP